MIFHEKMIPIWEVEERKESYFRKIAFQPFSNKRSFCSMDNLLFILRELIENESIPSDIYNVSDDEPISTNELISFISDSKYRKPRIWKISKYWIVFMVTVWKILRCSSVYDNISQHYWWWYRCQYWLTFPGLAALGLYPKCLYFFTFVFYPDNQITTFVFFSYLILIFYITNIMVSSINQESVST